MTDQNSALPSTPPDVEIPRRMSMVGWYRPSVIMRTAFDTLVSTIFGRHSDYRLLEALATESGKKGEVFYDYTHHYKVKDEGEIRDNENADWYLRNADGEYERDEQRKRDEIWIDYIADTGDGWNSTYAVAYAATKDELNLNVAGAAQEVSTRRGHLLIFGGDQVYPVASRKDYANRLLKPYATALGSTAPEDASQRTDPHPFVFATPGNHDWYDSLVSFTRMFCARRWFAGWQTRQTRSYYALRLPHNWWLIGIDVQLGSDLDGAQVRFFEEVVEHMEEGDRVILCTAEPHWVLGDLYQKYDEQYNDSNLKFFEEKILGGKAAKVHVYLSGDLHHYRRHEHSTTDGQKIQKITAGGGGAFLHPTHRMGRIKPEYDTKRETITDSVMSREERAQRQSKTGDDGSQPKVRVFTLEKSFPTPDESKKACRYNLFFLIYNPYFGLLTAILYWLSSWVVVPYTQRFIQAQAANHNLPVWKNFSTTFASQFPDAALTFWLSLIIAGFWLFTDTHSKWYRWVAGLAHGITHVVALILLCAFAYWVASQFEPGAQAPPEEFKPLLKLLLLHLLMALIIFAGGWTVGSTIMGIYLWASLNIFGRHYNEAFSALKIEDWKHFLRLHIGQDGALVIYPVGIPTVPREWKKNTDFKAHRKAQTVPAGTAGDDDKLKIHLIEPPIRIPR
jgi:Calcineurin-like phosphoesterase